ncbi:hypothetical protein BV22DRAFT_1024057, partial [Leucogyrophana mollusca]
MCLHRLPEDIVLFVKQLLKDRWTRLRFDDYLYWCHLLNGIMQGCPLSMILYIIYNFPLINITKDRPKYEAMQAYIDDAALVTIGKTF